jgi:hypothetical protein
MAVAQVALMTAATGHWRVFSTWQVVILWALIIRRAAAAGLCYQPIYDIVKQQLYASPKAKEVGLTPTGGEARKILDSCKIPYLGKNGCK